MALPKGANEDGDRGSGVNWRVMEAIRGGMLLKRL